MKTNRDMEKKLQIVEDDLRWLNLMKVIKSEIIDSKYFQDINKIEELSKRITNKLLTYEHTKTNTG